MLPGIPECELDRMNVGVWGGTVSRKSRGLWVTGEVGDLLSWNVTV